MPTDPLYGPTLKIERSKCHISEFQETAQRFLGDRPYKLVAKSDAEGTKLVIRVKKTIPLELSAIIGDAVHNLRSALDLLACDLVRRAGKSVDRVYFPFANNADDLGRVIKKRKLDRAGPKVVSLIKNLKPYKGGNGLLRAIHDLDIADKHKLLVPIATLGGLADASMSFGDTTVIRLKNVSFGPLENDVEIVHFPAAQHIEIAKETTLAITISFGNAEPFVENKPVFGTLHQMADLVQGIIETFKTHCL